MENANATPGVHPRDNSIVVLYRETDWIGRPTDLKDTEEYEFSLQRSRRNRIIMIAAAALVVVGVAIGVIIAGTSSPDEASVKAADTVADVPTATTTTTTTVAPTLDNTLADLPLSLNSTWNATSNAEVLVGGTGADTTTSTPETTTVAPTTTLEPTTTTAPTTTTSAPPTTTTVAPTTTPPRVALAPLSPGQIRYVNNCNKPYTLWKSHRALAKLSPGDSFVTQGTADVSAAYYLSDEDSGNATLFENHYAGGNHWYDISIIPVGCGASWDTCFGKPKSFNLPMSVRVSNPGGNCKHLTCASPSCTDAYFVPNDKQTWVCPGSVSMTVTFC